MSTLTTLSMSDDDRPSQDWNLDRLEKYAHSCVNKIAGFGRRSLYQTWLFGEALALIHKLKKGRGEWMEWLKTQPFSHGTANNAIKLHERISFEDLESFEGMTTTDVKIMLDILKRPPASKKQKPTPAPDQVADAATLPFPSVEGRTETDAGRDTPLTADDPDRYVTATDYARSPRKTPEPVVGPELTPAERLGQVLNLIVEVETSGVTADCSDLLIEIEAKVAALRQTLAVAATA